MRPYRTRTRTRTRNVRRPVVTGGDSERGSITAAIAMSAVPMIILAGLAVDVAGQVHARQHAIDVAAQAARTGGQQLQVARAVHGNDVRIDTSRAVAAARAFLTASDVTGRVTIRGGATVVVTTEATYDTKFLGIVGISTLTATGSAESRTVRSVNGTER